MSGLDYNSSRHNLKFTKLAAVGKTIFNKAIRKLVFGGSKKIMNEENFSLNNAPE